MSGSHFFFHSYCSIETLRHPWLFLLFDRGLSIHQFCSRNQRSFLWLKVIIQTLSFAIHNLARHLFYHNLNRNLHTSITKSLSKEYIKYELKSKMWSVEKKIDLFIYSFEHIRVVEIAVVGFLLYSNDNCLS